MSTCDESSSRKLRLYQTWPIETRNLGGYNPNREKALLNLLTKGLDNVKIQETLKDASIGTK